MTITLRPEQEQLVRDLLRSRCYENAEDAIDSALEMLRSQNEWLLTNRSAIDARIRQGIAELDRGEGIPEGGLDAYLARLKALSTASERGSLKV
jgi:Arc/MetJ-type ribon-helix-helix transcriptional regulator